MPWENNQYEAAVVTNRYALSYEVYTNRVDLEAHLGAIVIYFKLYMTKYIMYL